MIRSEDYVYGTNENGTYVAAERSPGVWYTVFYGPDKEAKTQEEARLKIMNSHLKYYAEVRAGKRPE